jgi:glycosyltransferase involved in cell wall biosynthesis
MSAEPGLSGRARPSTLDDRWRAGRLLAQEQALPSGSTVVSCPAPYGAGGLGRHAQEAMEALERRGQRVSYISDADRRAASRTSGPRAALARATVGTLIRPFPDWRISRRSARFDNYAASNLPRADHLICFNGTALAQLEAAREQGFASRSLMSGNSHMRRVIRQHDLAYRRYPLERPWATQLLARNLREYEHAERIHVASRYVWESFREEGLAEEKLSYFPLTPDARYEPGGAPLASSTFDVLYIGSLLVHKGVPLLLEAFARLPHADMRLILVGGWKTRGMRRFIERARARDPRIRVQPGDPLPHLRRARLCVHPAYEEGFGYAPAEALACGVPVIVSEDTGMKELLALGGNGVIVPTGELNALTDAIDAAYRGEILRG